MDGLLLWLFLSAMVCPQHLSQPAYRPQQPDPYGPMFHSHLSGDIRRWDALEISLNQDFLILCT
jgi:hypothetical protein